MKIIEITRTVSDLNYNNQTAKATLNENEDPIQAAIELDTKIKEMMAGIKDKNVKIQDFRNSKANAINILEKALAHAKDFDIPF